MGKFDSWSRNVEYSIQGKSQFFFNVAHYIEQQMNGQFSHYRDVVKILGVISLNLVV